MRLFRQLAALALLLAAASPAFADIALPKRPGADPNEIRRDLPTARMTIERVEGLREARLQIPRSRLQEMGLRGRHRGGRRRPLQVGGHNRRRHLHLARGRADGAAARALAARA